MPKLKPQNLDFLNPGDIELIVNEDAMISTFSVALHELIGHGSGKLLTEYADGTYNFDKEQAMNPLTNQKVSSWYKPGENY